MNTRQNADFLKKLTATFQVEAREHVQALGSGLVELEKAPDREAQQPLVERLFREAHSLKGAARAVDAGEIERVCQGLEGTFGALKSDQRALSAEALDGLHRAVTALGQLIDRAERGKGEDGMRNADCGARNPGRTTPSNPSSAPRAERGTGDGTGPAIPRSEFRVPTSTTEPAPSVCNPESAILNPQSAFLNDPADTVRIATSKLDAIFVQAEEMLGVKLAQAEHAFELKAVVGLLAERDRLWAETQPLVRGLREQFEAGAGAGSLPAGLPARLLAFLDQDREHAEALRGRVTELARATADTRRRLDTLADRLLEDVKKALMLPFSTVLAGFPKMVRDLARDAGKDMTFDMRGADIEIDRRILERIKDPLRHLVRNSVDHGIEPPAERARRQKTPCGAVTLTIAQAGGKVEVTVADDGAGVDVEAVKAAAIRAGAMTAGEAAALRDPDAMQLVFRSGVTTSRTVSAISGRGLGMAIVAENVASLGGTVAIESTPGAGTTVRVLLPLTLATLRGTLVRVANREFVIPTVTVARVLRVTPDSIKRVENRESICLDGTTLALVRLAAVLGLGPGAAVGASGGAAPMPVLILEHGQTCIAFAVDQMLGEQEVLAKPLGPLLVRVRNLAGATVLGAGRVVPVLSVPDLMQAAIGCSAAAASEPAADAPDAAARPQRLLVVDDSITARTLLQNILESAGYDVRSAPDGAAAYAMLGAEPFDLVVSDVEMPRMDGFELTKRIRAEPKFAELPVVLVTAREAPEDRERGVEAGANAYIVKSSFDQSNLIEVIGRLI